MCLYSHRFNPHRPVKAGASCGQPRRQGSPQHRFNPHRPVKAGASKSPAVSATVPPVSILTGPLRPVLLTIIPIKIPCSGMFQSSPAR